MLNLSAMYNLLQDYERLWELTQKGEKPLFTTDEISYYKWEANVKDITKPDFVEKCKRMNLQWVDPIPVDWTALINSPEVYKVVKKGVTEAYDKGQQSIIEKLKGLPRIDVYNYNDREINKFGQYLEWEEVEGIINQIK